MWQREAAGQRFGPYELREELGRGGSAVVYKAFDSSRQRYVAVKVIAAGYAADEGFRARFRREAEVIARLRHPHVLEVYESGEGAEDDPTFPDGRAFLVTELMTGGTLSSKLGAPRPGAERAQLALAIAQQIGAALDCAHEADVLHRDVKPSNVLIGPDGRFVLGDFGLARSFQGGATLPATLTGMVAGTPAYMAPEQALGEPADARTDLYGLAVLLYEIIAGRVPFSAETPLATMLAHVHQPVPIPEPLQGTAAPLATVLSHALAKSRDARYQSGAALSRALRDAVASVYGESQVATGAYQVISAALPDVPQATPGGSVRVAPEHPLLPLKTAPPDAVAPGRRRWRRLAGPAGEPAHDTGGVAAAISAGTRAGSAAASGAAADDGQNPAGTIDPRRRRGRWVIPVRLVAAFAATIFGLGVVATAGATLALGPGRPALTRLFSRFVTDAPPRIELVLPHNNAKNPTLRPSFTIAFTGKMDQEAVEHAVRFDPPVPLDFEWRDRFVVVQPRVDLQVDTEYVLIVDRMATDIEGRPLAEPYREVYRSISTLPAERESLQVGTDRAVSTPEPPAPSSYGDAPTQVPSPAPTLQPTQRPPATATARPPTPVPPTATAAPPKATVTAIKPTAPAPAVGTPSESSKSSNATPPQAATVPGAAQPVAAAGQGAGTPPAGTPLAGTPVGAVIPPVGTPPTVASTSGTPLSGTPAAASASGSGTPPAGASSGGADAAPHAAVPTVMATATPVNGALRVPTATALPATRTPETTATPLAAGGATPAAQGALPAGSTPASGSSATAPSATHLPG